MSYDCEVPDHYAEAVRTARKQHRCCECRQPIKKSEKYVACTAILHGDGISTYKQHLRCFHFARHFNYDLGFSEEEGCIEFGGIDYEVQHQDSDELRYLWWWIKHGYEFTPPVGSVSAGLGVS